MVVVPARHRVDDAVAGVHQRAVGRVDQRAASRPAITMDVQRVVEAELARVEAPHRLAQPPSAVRRRVVRLALLERGHDAVLERGRDRELPRAKSPTVRSQTGLPAATRTRISPAMRRISEPLILVTIPEMRAAPPAGGVATRALRSCAARTASDMTAQYDTGHGPPLHQCRRPSASSRLARTSWAESRTRCEVGWLVTRTANAIFGSGSGPAPT